MPERQIFEKITYYRSPKFAWLWISKCLKIASSKYHWNTKRICKEQKGARIHSVIKSIYKSRGDNICYVSENRVHYRVQASTWLRDCQSGLCLLDYDKYIIRTDIQDRLTQLKAKRFQQLVDHANEQLLDLPWKLPVQNIKSDNRIKQLPSGIWTIWDGHNNLGGYDSKQQAEDMLASLSDKINQYQAYDQCDAILQEQNNEPIFIPLLAKPIEDLHQFDNPSPQKRGRGSLSMMISKIIKNK